MGEESLAKAMPSFDLLDKKQREGWLAGSGIIYSIVRDCILGPVPSDASNLPTLIVWGSKDRHSPLKRAHSLKTELASSELIVLEKSGHLPQLDQPIEVVEIINRHISGLRNPA
jgi:pimeloyl-ACP methyl ester carboxylesterase